MQTKYVYALTTSLFLIVGLGVLYSQTSSNRPANTTTPLVNQQLQPTPSTQKQTATTPSEGIYHRDSESLKQGSRFQTIINPHFQDATTTQVVDALLDADRRGDNDIYSIAVSTLIRRAQLGDVEASKQVYEVIMVVSPQKRPGLVEALGIMATPDSLGALLVLAKSRGSGPHDLGVTALEEIRKSGLHMYSNGEYPIELSPLLERELDGALSDLDLLASVSEGISTLSTERGIETLLRKLEGGITKKQRDVIETAMLQTQLATAIPPLARRLQQDPELTSDVSRIAGDTLAEMSDPEAVEILLQWAAHVEGRKMRTQALTWFDKIVDGESLSLLLNARSQYTFRDPRLIKEITALAQKKDREWQVYTE